MPTRIPLNKAQADAYYPRAPIEKILGSDEGKRSTKSWLQNYQQALALAMLEEYGGPQGNFLKVLRRLEEREWDRKGIPAEKREWRNWSGPQRFSNIHTNILEHFISVDGKSLKVATRHEELREKADAVAKESAQRGEG